MTALAIALAVFVLSVVVVAHSAVGLLYVLCYTIAATAGLPAGFVLFSRRHPAGWIAGFIIGYALTGFALWAPIAAHRSSPLVFVGAWVVLSGAMWLVFREEKEASIVIPSWTPAASRALAAVIVTTLLVATIPLARVGEHDAAGNRRYRAYFTADFVWHTALTAELGKYAMPPHNPYLAYTGSIRGSAAAQTRLHYYWTYYLFPAVMSHSGPVALRDVQLCLRLNALITGILLMSAVFLSAWAAVGRAAAAAAAAVLALAASSAEGLYETLTLWSRGVPLTELRNWNIDAVTAWPPLGGHRIDGLQRCLWYVPQHSMAYALGLVAISVAAASGSGAPFVAIVAVGIALGCSVAFNPLVGGILSMAYGAAVLVDAARAARFAAAIGRHLVAVIPVALALVWCVRNEMVEGAGGFLQFGLLGASRQHPIETLLLSLGPILLIGAAGVAVAVRHTESALSAIVPSAVLAGVSLFLMYFVRLSVDQAWVAFRAGQMLIIALAAPAARFMAGTPRSVAASAFVGCLIAGAPTTIIDEYNAQDTSNVALGPGFPWTVIVTPEQQEAYRWLREHTDPTAIVQMDARSRERSTWSNIPTFAERRMAAGLPISLLNVPDYAQQSDLARRMYATANPGEAGDIARQLRLDYVYVDSVERKAYPQGIAFDRSSTFEKVFTRGDVAIYRLR